MRLAFRLVLAVPLSCIALLTLPCALVAQESAASPVVVASADPPEAPQPQFAAAPESAAPESSDQQTPAPQGQTTTQQAPASTPAQTPAAQAGSSSSNSSSQTPVPQTDAEKSAHDKAEEQLKAQEKQRVMGVMATFNTTSNKDALPLSSGQKFKLFFKSETDPWPFLLAGAVAGIGLAEDSYPSWGQGAQGYAKHYGAAYSDAFIGNFFGNALLTSLWHEDPRYFQKGTGSAFHRFLWAASSSVWCKRDNGKFGPNYANVVGNLIGAAISDTYYPANQRTVGNTISNGFTVTAQGVIGAEIIEFWPDLVRHHKQKQAEKLARQEAQGNAHSAAQDAAEKKAAPKSEQDTQQNQNQNQE
jgi:hypothetical protein